MDSWLPAEINLALSTHKKQQKLLQFSLFNAEDISSHILLE